MKDNRFLKFLDLFKGLFIMMGVDYPVMRKILQVKLLLDGRRVSTVLKNSNKKQTEDSNNFIKSLGMYLFLGLVLIPFIIIGDNFLFQMNIVFGILMFMLMTSLISDFSSVLLDVRDKEIILSKPVNSRTMNMAKIIHIFIYIFLITMAIAGPSLIAAIIKRGFLFFIIYLGEIILLDLFVIVITAMLYLMILRFFDGEKLKDIINYVQIGLTISITIGYQFVGRMFQYIDLENIKYIHTWWKYLMPTIWFAAPFEMIINGSKQGYLIVYSILMIIIPITSLLIYIKLIPSFENSLQKLNSASGKSKNKSGFTIFVSRLVCKSKEERTFYRFSTNMIKNERDFKLKVYPQLALSVIFPFIMMIARLEDGGFAGLAGTNAYYGMYLSSLMVSSVVPFMVFSVNHKAAWIYTVTPISEFKYIYKGSLKALFINLITPVFLIVSCIFLSIFKTRIILDIIVIYFNVMLYTKIAFNLMEKSLPFSEAFDISRQRGNLFGVIGGFIFITILAGIHYGMSNFSYGLYIYLAIIIVVNLVVWNTGYGKPLQS